MRDDTAPQSMTLQDLWSEACRLADFLPQIFGEPAAIAGAGLSRRVALRCSNWLWSIEALVRRIIIAAALAFDPKKLTPLRQRISASSAQAPRPSANAASFRLFAFVCPTRRPHARSSTPRPYAHVPFPTDDLLRLGVRPPRPRDSEASDQPRQPAEGEPRPRNNPLRCRARISRWDPDYCPDMESRPAIRLSTPQLSTPRMRHAHVSSLHRLPSAEWRRVEDEWERVLPAPGLARRILGLLRVIEKPMLRITRLARRLQKGNLAARFPAQGPPHLRRPRLDRTQPLQLGGLIAAAHGHIQPDTS